MAGTTTAATTNVTTTGFYTYTFSPQTVNIAVGDTVSWSGLSGAGHTVTADDGSFDFSGGDTFSRTFNSNATISYYCKTHGGPGGVGMSGTIVVGSGAAATSTPTTTPVATSTPTPSSRTVLAAAMSPLNQVSPTVTTGGYGSVRLTFDASAGTITGQWALNNLTSTVTNAHIHSGAAGTNGPVFIDFSDQVAGRTGAFTSTTTGVAADRINSVLANPGGFYVNVHTTNNGGGETRGQLVVVPQVVSNVVTTGLSGANGVPPVTTGGSGEVTLAMDATAGTVAGRWVVTGLSSNA